MEKQIKILLIVIIFGIGNIAFNLIKSWKVDKDKYLVTISGKKIEGTFTGLKATLNFDPLHPEQGRLSASIDAGSLSTGFFLKTRHALSVEGLYAAKFPTIRFQSDDVKKKETPMKLPES